MHLEKQNQNKQKKVQIEPFASHLSLVLKILISKILITVSLFFIIFFLLLFIHCIIYKTMSKPPVLNVHSMYIYTYIRKSIVCMENNPIVSFFQCFLIIFAVYLKRKIIFSQGTLLHVMINLFSKYILTNIMG